MFENNSIMVKVAAVKTRENSSSLSAVNHMLEKNLANVNYLAVDRQDVKNLEACKTKNKFRLLNRADEQNLVQALRGADLIFIIADEVWENIKAVALVAHCAKKVGVPVIFIAGGNFEDAEDEIIFDELIKLPNKNFEYDSGKIVEEFIEAAKCAGDFLI